MKCVIALDEWFSAVDASGNPCGLVEVMADPLMWRTEGEADVAGLVFNWDVGAAEVILLRMLLQFLEQDVELVIGQNSSPKTFFFFAGNGVVERTPFENHCTR